MIHYVNTLDDAEYCRVKRGAIPVECSFGGRSSVCDLVMDHHGPLSHLEGVALRGYRDAYGAAVKEDGTARDFVVTGAADADACFCIASLLGVIPEQGLEQLARVVNLFDTEPSDLDILDGTPGYLDLLVWNNGFTEGHEADDFERGVQRWVDITTGKVSQEEYTQAVEKELDRRKRANETPVELFGTKVGLVINPTVWAFDLWYKKAPVFVVFSNGKITIGAKNTVTARTMFGPEGLGVVFKRLQPTGWGGREGIGGSPRGMAMSLEDALVAVQAVREALGE